MSWKEKLARFMQGRYGVDSFSKFLLGAAVVCILLSAIFRSNLFNLLGWVCLIYTYVRMLSRNYAKRSAENQKYLQLLGRVKGIFQGNTGAKVPKDREHKIYKCPVCGQKTRVPRGKGKIEIECPKCHNKFVKRT
jgi:DNA-directed RNA polymerase subunit RPC12/RpoP